MDLLSFEPGYRWRSELLVVRVGRMPRMGPVEVLGILTLIATLIGWRVTYVRQKAIQRQAHEYQRRDQNLSVYRARMEKAAQLTRTLLESSDVYYKFSSLATANLGEGEVGEKFFKHYGLELMRELPKAKLEMAIVLYDPEYRTLRDLLTEANEEKSKELYDGLRANAHKAADYSDHASKIDWSDSNKVQADMQWLATEGAELGDELTALADLAGNGFAHLDRLLSANDEHEGKSIKDRGILGWPRRSWEWFMHLVLGDDYLPPSV